MRLHTFSSGVTLDRKEKALIAHFPGPYGVISTSTADGGLQRGMEYAINFQSCEGCKHEVSANYRDSRLYRRYVCEPLGVPPEKAVMMGTAANMHFAAIVSRSFEDLEVTAVVTGGVESNAGRAGDPASVVETPEGFFRLVNGRREPGTINIMLLISKPMTDGALTRCIILATEAKTVALQELAVNSRYSPGLATGTGTDQMIVAAPDPADDSYRLFWAGKHAKLGELIGLAVTAAVKETLARQNGLTPSGQCSAKIHLERFGCTNISMKEGIIACLDEKTGELLGNNFQAINHDPLVVAAVAALAHLQDKLDWGILPKGCRMEIMGAAAAQLACATGGHFEKIEGYRERLGECAETEDFLQLCWEAIAVGYADRWSL